ncbi:sensor domain-containing protein [Metabacillus fastidiosus]|uniref:sensor domain-containing protein n=1 Tax=Metabacillus fastidiosus TaxID=1458 RepID=UPI0014709A7A|nr:EAL domain-containing protein [Metabacillus fastidiosus]MED4461030.1 EAL domain-containing protein [Metabacillus fastidiosus]
MIPALSFAFHFGLRGSVIATCITVLFHTISNFNGLFSAENTFNRTLYFLEEIIIIAFCIISVGILAEQLKYRNNLLTASNKKLEMINNEAKKNYELYRSLIELIPEIIIIHRNGTILFINSTGAEILGPDKPENFIGQSLFNLIHPDSKDILSKRLQSINEKKCLDLNELKALSLKGNTVHIESTAISIDYYGQPATLSFARNISSTKQAYEELTNSEKRYRTLFEHASDAIYLFEMDKRGKPLQFIDVNNVACERFGYSREELLSMSPLDITSKSRLEKVDDTQQELLENTQIMFEGEYISKTGEKIPSEISASIITLGNKKVTFAISRDIRERKKAEEQIKHLAFHDSLTGLLNRSSFNSYLNKTIEEIHLTNEKVAVLFLDLDRFKITNDTLGHHIGDLLLVEAARRLENCVSEKDIVARQGGDEFIILLHHTEQSILDTTSIHIVEELNKPFIIEGHEIFTSPSIGISIYPHDGKDSASLIKNADTAMYAVKTSGKNNYQYYSSEMNQKNKRKMLLESALRNALNHNELSIYYQPKINIHTKELTGVEALLRWNSTEHGTVSPTEFIPIAEESGLIIPIGEWVLKTACRQNKLWQDSGYVPINMSINLSARQFQQNNLIPVIKETLEETQLDSKYLNLEITETMAMININQSVTKLKQLKELGVSLSLDDFGTGYSSLNYLKKFPLDVLKIDKSFIHDIISDEQSTAIVKAIISVSKSLNLTVIAEGVETIEQLEILKSEKCDLAQGYYYSPPIPAYELEKMLTFT